MSSEKSLEIMYSAFYILLPIVLGGICSLLISRDKIPKVDSKLNPPGWLFGVVWPVLYLCLGFSMFFLYKKWLKASSQQKGLIGWYLMLFVFHVVLLNLWWVVFNWYSNKVLSVVSILFLVIYALWLAIRIYPISSTSSFLLIPYICWISFASYLTYRSR